MSEPSRPESHNPAIEPKFCRCRVCHEHFYGETISAAHAACVAHAEAEHPQWREHACYCPD